MLQAPIPQEVTGAQEMNPPPAFPASANPSDLLHFQISLRTSSAQIGICGKGRLEPETRWRRVEKGDEQNKGVKETF